MNLHAHYDALHAAALPPLRQGRAAPDLLLDSPHDTRRGVTLLARPSAAIAAHIGEVLAEFQQVAPEQYYYPASDLHLTILSIISCYAGFTLPDIDPTPYAELVAAALRGAAPFRIRLAGLAASPAGVLVRGFPEGNGLAPLRDELRRVFRASGLQQSIDQRYSIQTAHCTVLRFRGPLPDADPLLRVLAAYRAYPFGTLEVHDLELVFNDWYQRAAHTVLLKKYQL
ncbi:2'-5' RNA ligase family protein [Hymenobacter psoromatis]|uniref:2'-5' RNA ligase family protein n=1 Tax=Hymenobacter psoromatis TaxID=1484116 RepID=UPI001CBB32D1|nr:mutarotase [Hymenobacter psoromatis]